MAAAGRGSSKSRLVFKPMPGNNLFTGTGLTNFGFTDTGIERYNTSTGRWLAPGEPVKLHGFDIHEGMIYFGSKLTALNGYGVEPSLVDPRLEVSNPQANVATKIERYYSEYQSFDPVGRWKYLKWLSTGRKDPTADSSVVYLYLYGLERRIISSCVQATRRLPHTDPPLVEPERQALRDELVRLYKCYPDASFQRSVLALLTFLDLSTLLVEPEQASRFNSAVIAALPRTGGEIPALLAVLLANFALHKTPIEAEWAWAWFCQDSESNLRAAAVRCPDEMRQLFMARFPAEVGPKGITLRTTKSPIYATYYPISPGYARSVSAFSNPGVKHPDLLRKLSRTGLKKIGEIAYACMDDLDTYSRRVGRDPAQRNTLPVVALLPDPLFAAHPETVKFRKWLDALVPTESNRAATVPASQLLGKWQDSLDGKAAPLSRSDTVKLLDAMDRLGFVLEPDARTGGPVLAGATAAPSSAGLVAAIARRGARTKLQAPVDDATTELTSVSLPLLVRAARAAGVLESQHLRTIVGHLPHAAKCDPGRLGARLAYLVANPKESAKAPKPKELALEMVTPADRAHIADVLTSVASLSGAVSPAAVTELIKLFGLLGLPDSEVYARLHASASVGTSSRQRGADDALATVKTGKQESGFALPKAPPKAVKKTTAGGGVAIDHALVRQKQAESAQISTLLADIFTEEAPLTDDVFDATVGSEAPLAGSLDVRHSALLRGLLAKDSWTKAEFAALARAENLLPNAALDTINEAAFERFDEPVLNGDDPVYLSIDLARELLS